MGKKYKTTGCAKFFLVLIILMPLAYLGASYYNGQDGWANLKNHVGFGSNSSEASVDSKHEGLQSEVADLSKELKRLERENEQLAKDLKACQNATN